MTPEFWAQVKVHFHEAAALPAEQREAYLTSIADPAMAAEVRQLLEYNTTANLAIDRPAAVRIGSIHEVLAGALDPASPQSGHRRIGDLIGGRFEIRAFAGSGGMGEVYEAHDRELDLRVALKMLRPELVARPELVERFKQEIQNARAVTHPNVCRVFDVGRHQTPDGAELYFCTMAFVDGAPLSQLIREHGAVAPSRLLSIAGSCAAALDAAHTAGILHCDFKSANVLIGRDPDSVFVTDFGLSRAWSVTPGGPPDGSGSGSASVVGTPAYMAPEQLRGDPPTPASDIYAFGVVLYEMATGQSPYEGVSPVAMVARKASELPPSPRQIRANLPKGWDAVILRCLAIDPADRFVTASDVMAALTDPMAATRRRWMAAGGGAGAVALVLGAGSYVGGWFAEDDVDNRWLQQGRMAIAENAPRRAAYLFEQRLAEDPGSALARAYLATTCIKLDRLDAARDHLLALDRKARYSRRTSRYVEAARAIVLRDWSAATAPLEYLLETATGPEYLALALEKAAVLAEDGKTRPALDTLAAATSRYPNEAALQLQRGILLARTGEKDEALGVLRQAEAAFRASSNPEGAAEALLQVSRILQDNQDLPSAQAVLEEALSLAASNRLPALEVRLQGTKANLLIAGGQRDEAEVLASRTVEFARRNDLAQLAAAAENDLASSFLTQQLFENAETHFRSAIQLAQSVRAGQEEARAHLNLASTLTRRGRMQQALSEIQQGLPFYRKGNYRAQTESGLLLEAQALLNLGRHNDAVQPLSEAASSGNRAISLRARESLADIAAWRGDFKGAFAEKGRLLDAYREMKRVPAAAYMLIDQAMLRVTASRSQEADELLAQAREFLAPLGKGGQAILDRESIVHAQLLLSQGRYADAVSRIAKMATAMTVRDGMRRWQVLSLLGELEGRARPANPAGWSRCETAYEEARKLEVVEVRVEVLSRLAIAAFLAGRKERAEQAASEVRDLSIRHGFRFWHLVSLCLLMRLQPVAPAIPGGGGSGLREEREQLVRTYGDDEEGPIGPRLVDRPDFKQIL